MADISKIKLPSGNEYDIKDATARQMISGGVSFNVVWTATDYASTTAPDATKLATIPAGVTVYYNSGTSSATGTLAASSDTVGKFYLAYSKTQTGGLDYFDEYVTVGDSTYAWEKIGDTQVVLTNVVTDVTLNQQTTNFVTGYASPSTDTFVKSVSAETNKKLVTTSITPAGTAASVVNSVTDTTSKLVTSTVTGVKTGSNSTTTASKATAATSQTTADGTGTTSSTNTDWLKGVSVASETLTIGAATMDTQTTTQFTFADVTVPIRADSATTVATGSLDATGAGATVMTGTTTGTTNVATVGTAVTVATGATAANGGGDAIVTGVTIGESASALTGLGTASTSAGLNTSTSITVTKAS